jgi:alkylation response protein AidB-like acyl-CoA dehydrogenase
MSEAFRDEIRSWLDAHLTDRFRGLRGSVMDLDPERLALAREWNHLLADAGYAAIAWPVAFGGRGAGRDDQVVLAEEMTRADAPGPINVIGLPNIGPSIMQWGTDAQKARYLRPMLWGEEIWCQGFSEPDAGSDLASLRTTAVRDSNGDFVVNGQKTWNSLGHLADWCELLVRTTPLDAAPKHKGISALLVDMRSPGIEVRPMVTITGEREFSELFFTDVRVPADALLGPENEGWRVALTTLTYERAGVSKLHLALRKKVSRLLAEPTDDPVTRQVLAKVYIESELLGMAGNESSVAKLLWSDAEQHLAEAAVDSLGPDGLRGQRARDLVYSRALSIAGGTTQVNKNILAERVLGLPREPKS